LSSSVEQITYRADRLPPHRVRVSYHNSFLGKRLSRGFVESARRAKSGIVARILAWTPELFLTLEPDGTSGRLFRGPRRTRFVQPGVVGKLGGREGSSVATRIASVSGLRGIVGDGLDPAAVVEFAAAYATEVGPGRILVGHDGRTTAPMMVRAVVAGLSASGCEVDVLGAQATPTIGVLVRESGAAGAVQISASHNPPEYNGLKFFQPGGMVLSPAQGRSVVRRFEEKAFRWASWDGLGKIVEPSPVDPSVHVDAVLATVDVDAIRRGRFRVVLDGCHGGGGRLGAELLRRLGCEVRLLGGEPDGLYDHTPEPTEANLGEMAAIVPAVGAAIGFAQDPDADRLAIIDETGRYIGEELTLALATRRCLAGRPGPVVMNLSTSRASEDVARALGCPVHRTPVGEIHVVERMKAEGAVLGGEGNGGVIDPRVGFVRDSLAGMALVLDLLAAEGRPLSALVEELPRYAMVKEKYPLGELPVSEVLDRIAGAHPDASADRSDGLRLDWHDCWAHVRASNTEPIVRIIAEARDEGRARELADLLGRWVRGGSGTGAS
jgi:phosphomannomutase